MAGTAWAKVNINTADLAELDTIPEVGPSTAAKIIAYREANGNFQTIEDIMKVSGIKEATFAKLRDFITVGDESADEEPEEPDADAPDTLPEAGSLSSHSGAKELTALEKKAPFEIGAGRKRIAVVGAPVDFEAAVNKSAAQTRFEWSFGDGATVRGRKATHRYLFPGVYSVVVKGRLDSEEAVARTEVEVIEPLLAVTLIDGAVKIKNPTKQEINLGGWRLAAGERSFVIPADTLLLPGGATIIPTEISKLKTGNQETLVLQNPLGRAAATDQSKAEKILALQTQLVQARAQLAKLAEARPLTQLSTTSLSVIELPRQPSWWENYLNEIFR